VLRSILSGVLGYYGEIMEPLENLIWQEDVLDKAQKIKEKVEKLLEDRLRVRAVILKQVERKYLWIQPQTILERSLQLALKELYREIAK